MEPLTKGMVESDIDVMHRDAFDTVSELPEARAWGDWLLRLHVIWQKRRSLYKTAACALVVSVGIAFLIPKRYESTASIMPPDSLGSSVDGGMMMAALASKASPELAGVAANMLGVKGTGELFVGLLHSRTVEEGIINKFDLQSVYWVRYKQDARKILERRTEISADRKTGIITITISDDDPRRALGIAQAFIEGLNNLVSEVSISSARRERIFIEQRLSTVKVDLEDAEQQFSVFASKNTALDIKEQNRAMVESVATLQGRLIAAESDLEGLRQVYSPNNVRVRSAQAQVDELKQQLSKIGGSDASVSEPGNPSSQLYPTIRKLPLLGVEWEDLYRRVKIQETVYELLNQQYELARIQEAKEIPTVNVIDPANLPEEKSWPPRLLIITSLVVFCLGATAAWLLANAEMDQLAPTHPGRLAFEAINDLRTRMTRRPNDRSISH